MVEQDKLLTSMSQNFFCQSRIFGGGLAGVRWYEETPEVIHFSTGLPGGWLNRTACFNLTEDRVTPLVASITPLFKDIGASADWVVATCQPSGQSLMRVLKEHGWIQYAQFLGMRRTKKISPTGMLPACELKQVTSIDSLEDWLGVFFRGFNVQAECLPFARSAYARTLVDSSLNFEHFLLCREGVPIACASVHTHGGLSMLYNVSTDPVHRLHGAGSTLTALLLDHIEEQGCKDHFLYSQSHEVCSFYARLGFERFPSNIAIHYLQTSRISEV